jgi:hypothetical protein
MSLATDVPTREAQHILKLINAEVKFRQGFSAICPARLLEQCLPIWNELHVGSVKLTEPIEPEAQRVIVRYLAGTIVVGHLGRTWRNRAAT